MNEDIEKVMNAANFMYSSQGYVDIDSIEKISGVPSLVVSNILVQKGFSVL